MTTTGTAPVATAGGADAAVVGAPKRGYLRQVDLVRIVAFATVVAVHSTSMTVPGNSHGAGIALMLLHCTREVFFLITGFVLIRSYAFRPMNVPAFLRKRMTLAGIPYVVWSLIYFGYSEHWHLHGLWLRQFGYDLLTGTAFYHLYFLLVTLQAYLLLPLLLKLLRWTQGHHKVVFAVSLAVNLLLLQGIVAAQTMHGAPHWLADHAEPLLLTYQFYLIAGALAAWHLADFQRWVEAHPWIIATCLICAGIVAEGTFFLRLHHGANAASAVLQPAQLPWSVAVALTLYALASRWAERGPGRISGTLVREGSYASFGVYLLHPMVLALIDEHGLRPGPHQILSPPWVTLLTIVLVLAITTPIVLVVQRTPLSLPLTGRPMRRRASRRAGTPAPSGESAELSSPTLSSLLATSASSVVTLSQAASGPLAGTRVVVRVNAADGPEAVSDLAAAGTGDSTGNSTGSAGDTTGADPTAPRPPDPSRRRVVITLAHRADAARGDGLTPWIGKRHVRKEDNPDVQEPLTTSRT